MDYFSETATLLALCNLGVSLGSDCALGVGGHGCVDSDFFVVSLVPDLGPSATGDVWNLSSLKKYSAEVGFIDRLHGCRNS